MPTPPTAIAILEFGHLLWVNAQRSVADREEGRIKQTEEHLMTLLYDERPTILRSALDFNNCGKNIDPTTLRVLCLVAHVTLCTARLGTTVGEVACGIGNDAASILATRQVISNLLIRKHLIFRDERSDCVSLGKPLLDYFGGGAEAPSLVPTEWSLQTAQYRAELAKSRKKKVTLDKLPSAKELAARIAADVVGLDAQVKTLSCRLAMHLRRAALISDGRDPGSPNECLLLIGPSGSGKTWIAESAGRTCGLPFGVTSATDMTSEGYVGLSTDDAVKRLVESANHDYERARFGMCFIDEIDKKRSSSWDAGGRDVAGSSVQHGLLRLVEGTHIQIGGRKGSYDWAPALFNSWGTCFLFAGAFLELDQLLNKQGAHGIGFTSCGDGSRGQRFISDALEDYGMIPEFVNRLSGILTFPAPTTGQLTQIVTRCVVPAFNRLLGTFGAEVQLSDDGIHLIAEITVANGTYARGAKAAVAALLEDVVFDQAHGKIQLGIDDVRRAVEAAGLGALAAEKHPDSTLQSRSV